MMYYLYLGHLGNFYTENHKLENMDIYCECCGEYDELVDTFKTREELTKLLVLAGAYDETIDYVVDRWESLYE